MREQQERLDAYQARAVVVSFESPARAAMFANAESVPFPLLLDPTRRAYAAFGLQKGTASRLWGWSTLTAYLRGIVQGRRLALPHADITQLGGDFVLNAEGRIVFVHRSEEPADRPAISEILAALDATVREQPTDAGDYS